MAYNLESLIHILEQILHPIHHHRPNWVLDGRKKPIIESLLQKACLLKDYLDNNSFSETGNDFSSLGSRIRDAANHAQNIIESHLTDLLLSKDKGDSILISPPKSLQKVEDKEFEPIFDELAKIMESGASLSHPFSSPPDLNPKNTVVGLNEDLSQLKEDHIMGTCRLKVIPIVGMGGIGKTTLARTLYRDPFVVSRFDIRLWAVASQNYNERKFLMGLCKSRYHTLSAVVLKEENSELVSRLHKELHGRRYLIVVDDIWSCEVWDCLRLFTSDENNGSRILVTTRERSLANYVAGANRFCHEMKFLNETHSWNLLCRSVFAEEAYPPELEAVGKIIANNCMGLPLTIHVVGGVLSLKEKTQEAWKQVAEDVSSVAENDEHLLNILSLSYRYMPAYLKPCFLYLGAFPEDWEIQATNLIKLWVAEGFIKPSSGSSFEDTANEYLKELVERNLLMVRKQETADKVKSYSMHDILRELCIKKAQEENFLHVGSGGDGGGGVVTELSPKNTLRVRLSAVYGSYDQLMRIIDDAALAIPVIPSLIIFGNRENVQEMEWVDKNELRLLRVLDLLSVTLPTLPKSVEKLFHLRYLAARLSSYSNLPVSLSNLCNMQTLTFYQDQVGGLPGEQVRGFFDLPQLRHIKFKRRFPLFVLEQGERVTLHQHLQTLSTVAIDDSFSRILEAIPNLKKLGIFKHNHTSISSSIDLSCLTKLEILRCISGSEWTPGVLPPLIFPHSLQKLTIYRCGIPKECPNEIGNLPNLQVLKLRYSFFKDDYTWAPNEGQFPELKVLELEQVRLEQWIADQTHYPKLTHLLIRDCSFLEKIPEGVGNIDSLEIIELRGGISRSGLLSAWKIEDDRDDLGNTFPQVLTHEASVHGFCTS